MTREHFVVETLENIYEGDFAEDCSLETFIRKWTNYQDKYQKIYTNLNLRFIEGYDGLEKIELIGERPENEAERKRRLKAEKISRDARKRDKKIILDRERKMYERLKKKFEK